jgi:hypothetical protein
MALRKGVNCGDGRKGSAGRGNSKLFQIVPDFRKDVRDARSDIAENADDDDGDQRGNESVFDCGGRRFIADESSDGNDHEVSPWMERLTGIAGVIHWDKKA